MRHALWLGGLLVVLAGLLGMHGLDNHGSAAMSGHAAVAMDAVAHLPVLEAHHTGSGSGHPVAANLAHITAQGAQQGAGFVAAAVLSNTGSEVPDTGATGMCMAVLVFGLLALLLHLGARRVNMPVWLLARLTRVPVARGRDPDPPCLFTLSIQCC